MDAAKLYDFVSHQWDSTIVPTLSEYIRIPNQSPAFDKEWATNGHMDKAVQLMVDWVHAQKVPGLDLEVVRLPGRTPLIYITVPSTDPAFNRTIFMYGHMDKQPPLTDAWAPGLGPYSPVIRDGKLYGRGGADDGYAVFGAITALKALQEQNQKHGRIVLIIEGCEESGSPDLPHYIAHLKDRIGTPDLIVCLDSGCGTYDQLWITTSLRGLAAGVLKVEVIKEGSHSGHASGIVPSSFRILRQVLSRLEDENTGEVLPKELHCEIPEERLRQAKTCAEVLGHTVFEEFKWVDNTKPVTPDVEQALLNRTWRPTVSYVGIEGLPALSSAGNVLRPYTAVKLSVRLPPRVDAEKAAAFLKTFLEKDAPYGAKVTFEWDKAGTGWDAPALAPWLEKSLEASSNNFFKKPANFLSEGGSIPFMGMLGRMFPEAQFCVTGVLGPENNAHGPNEMLVIDMGKKVTACVAQVVGDHYNHFAAQK